MRKKDICTILLLLLLSAAAAIWGTGKSYHAFITPISSVGEFKGIHGDGWVANGARIQLRSLARRGNRIEMEFKDWRPSGLPPARFQVFVCGRLASEFEVQAGRLQTVYLKGDCEPRELELKVLNPFVPSETDQRELGAELSYVKVTSRLKVPLVAASILLKVFLVVFTVAVLAFFFLREFGLPWLAAAVPPTAFFFLSQSIYLKLDKVFPVGFFACALLAGLLAASKLGSHAESNAAVKDDRVLSRILLITALAAGTFLRFYGLNFGHPTDFHAGFVPGWSAFHPDEVPKWNAIQNMVAHGDLNPRYFLHPSLLLYMTYFSNCLLRWLGIFQLVGIDGDWNATLIQAGRVGSATAGVLSIFFVYLIGRRLSTRFAGAVAALFLAVMPLHITCSRYVKEDALLVCMILACAAVFLKAVQEDRKWLFLLSGLLAGCAASVKYSGMLAAAIIFAAPWLRSGRFVPERSYIKWTAAALFLLPLGFVLCTPYSILDSAKFVTDFLAEKSHMERGHTIVIDAWSQFWLYHFSRSIIPGASLSGSFLAVAGMGVLLYKRRMQDFFLLALILLFYLPAEYVKAKPAPQPERYILPVLPFLALAAGGLIDLIRRAEKKAVLMPVAVLLLAGFPAFRSARLAGEVAYDTRTQMAQWMVANLEAGSSIYMDWKPYTPRFFNGEFDLDYLPRAKIIPSLDVSDLKKSGKDYLLMSSLFYARYFTQPEANPALREQIRQIFRRVPIVKEIAPRHGTYGFHNPTLTLFSLKEEDFSRLQKEIKLKQEGRLNLTSNEQRSSFRWHTQ